MTNQNNISLIGRYWNTSTKSNNDGKMSVPMIGRHFFFLFFFISDHFIQKPCYIITLCSPGEIHRGPCDLHNSFDQGKYQNE